MDPRVILNATASDCSPLNPLPADASTNAVASLTSAETNASFAPGSSQSMLGLPALL